MLHNPHYAGAYAYGRGRRRRRPDGSVGSERMPTWEWTVLLRDAHSGYIAWDRFEAHQRQLRDDAQPAGAGVRPARVWHFCRASRYAACAVAG